MNILGKHIWKCGCYVLATLIFADVASASTAIYDFSGSDPLGSFKTGPFTPSGSFQVANEELVPPLVADFYNTTLLFKEPVSASVGDTIMLTADFQYDTSLINSGPQEVPGLALIIATAPDPGTTSGIARGEMRAVGVNNRDVFAYSVTYDVNSRNEGNPLVVLEDGARYRLAFSLLLVGGPFNDELELTTELFKLTALGDQLVSSFSVPSNNFRLLQLDSYVVGLHAQQSAGISSIDNFSVTPASVPEPATLLLLGLGLAGLGFARKRLH